MPRTTLLFLLLLFSAQAHADSFYLNSDGTVADLKSGLLWQGSSVTVSSFDAASSLCRVDGSQERHIWRLPTRNELRSLEEHLLQMTPTTYWTKDAKDEKGGIYCFGDGAVFSALTVDIRAEVRCVADNPLAPALEAFNLWAEAWRSADIEGYLSAYVPAYRPRSGIDHQSWSRLRRQRIGQAGGISLSFQPEEMRQLGSDAVEIVTLQEYRSSRYQDRVRKRLRLEKKEGRWLIAQEEQLSTLPFQRLSKTFDIY